jgi:hypothetical protein
LSVCLVQATLQLHKQMQATEKTRLAEQQAATTAAAAAAAGTPQLAFAGANGSHSEQHTPEGSAMSSLDESSSSNGNGHHVPVPAGGGTGDLHAVRLSGGATYSPSIPVENGSGHGSSGTPAEQGGSSGPSPVKEKVKLQ